MIIKLERVEKEKAYINFSQKANKAQYHMNTDSYLSFLPPFNQLCRSLHNTANELVSTGMYKRIISSRTLFVSEISVLRALWPVHRNIFSHLSFQPLIKAMQFKNSRPPFQKEFVVNSFPLWKACDGSELPGMLSSHTATYLTASSTWDNHNQKPLRRNTRIQKLSPLHWDSFLLLWLQCATTRKIILALFHTTEKTSEEIKRAPNLQKETAWVFC